MITHLKTHESVPVGGNNFSELLEYIRSFLGANFSFSTNALVNRGGFFRADNFAFNARTGAGGNRAVFFTPTGRPSGNLFGTIENEYIKLGVLTNDGEVEPQVYQWEVLATASRLPQGMSFSNLGPEDRQLPYRPVNSRVVGAERQYAYGYLDVRFNGIPQNNYSLNYSFTGNSFSTQELSFSRLVLGAESPLPISNGRYDSASNVSSQILNQRYNNRLTFEHTNFSLDFGAHILLWRRSGLEHRFSYMPQDLGSGINIAPGTFRVLDHGSGTIELNIARAQLEALLFPGESVANLEADITFDVVSAEHLREETLAGIQHFYTRYGRIYDGEATTALLAEYVFDGARNVVRAIPQSEYFGGAGDLLLQDINNRYSGSVVLGIRYNALPNVEEIRRVQGTRFHPDTLQLYFHLGIVLPAAISNSQIRCFLEQNPSSWYNRNVLDAEYFPVNRTVETFHAFVTADEANLFPGAFDPNLPFNIADALNLVELRDVGAVGPDQALVRNTANTEFIGLPYTLAALFDTAITSPANNHILRFWGGRWVNSPRPTALDNLEGTIRYTQTVAAAIGTATPPEVLVTKGYVDSHVGGTGGDISAHVANTGPDIHGATTGPMSGRLVIRDSAGLSQVGRSGATLIAGSAADVVNVDWIRTNATEAATPHTIARRRAGGGLRVANGAEASDAVNLGQLTAHANLTTAHGSRVDPHGDSIMQRDSRGISQVATSPVLGPSLTSNDIVNVSWINAYSTAEAIPNTLARRRDGGRMSVANGVVGLDAVNLNQLNAHANLANPHHAAPEAWGGRIILRDAGGRASVVSPTTPLGGSSHEIVNVNWISERTTSGIVGNTLIARDAHGRARVASPHADADIATKGYVDSLAGGMAPTVNRARTGFFRLGDFIIAWGSHYRSGGGSIDVVGPVLPSDVTSDNSRIVSVQATGGSNENPSNRVVLGIPNPGGTNTGTITFIDGSRRPRCLVTGHVVTGNPAWAAWVVWFITRG